MGVLAGGSPEPRRIISVEVNVLCVLRFLCVKYPRNEKAELLSDRRFDSYRG